MTVRFRHQLAEGLPADWDVSRIKHIARSEPNSFTDGDWVESPYITDSGIRLVQTGNIGVGRYREQGYRYISPSSFRELGCTEVHPGDILICRLADPVGRACIAPDLGESMITAVDVAILKPRERHDPRFLVYFFSSAPYLEWLDRISRGGTRNRISRRMLGDVHVPTPSRSHQEAIADFLDEKSARIDQIVDQKSRQLQLIEHHHQALARRLVSRGVDAGSEDNRQTDVEWAPEIPKTWNVVKVKDVAEVVNGYAFDSSHFSPDKGTRLVRIRDVTGTGEPVYFSGNDPPGPYVEDGDILIGMDGDFTVDRWSGGQALLNQRVCCVRPTGPRLLRDYLLYALPTPLQIIEDLTYFTTVKHLSSGQVRNIKILLPPVDEQQRIVRYLNAHRKTTQNMRDDLDAQISTLQEYRTSLITAAVTGQIDVGTRAPAVA